jgi:hypothetical protein
VVFFILSSYRPSLFHRGWMVSHTEMGIASGAPISTLIPSLYTSSRDGFLFSLSSSPSTRSPPRGVALFASVCCICRQWDASDTVRFFLFLFCLVLPSRWCFIGATRHIPSSSLRLLADIKWFIGVGSDTSGCVGCVSFCWVFSGRDPWRGVGVRFFFFGRIASICAVFSGLPPVFVLAGVEHGSGEGALGCRKCLSTSTWPFLVISCPAAVDAGLGKGHVFSGFSNMGWFA